MTSHNNQQYMNFCNHETWLCQMWLQINEKEFEKIKLRMKNLDVLESSKYLAEYVYDNMPNLGANMYNDLLSDAIDHVDFYELAKYFKIEK